MRLLSYVGVAGVIAGVIARLNAMTPVGVAQSSMLIALGATLWVYVYVRSH